MAVLASIATGNFTASSTWGVVNAAGWSQILTTQETGTTAVTTSYQVGQNFTVASNTTVIGILLKVNSNTSNGTFTARIYNVTGAAAVANTTTTVSLASGVVPGNNQPNWIFVKFASSASLATATNYRIEVLGSVNANITLYRKSATTADWTFGLVTDATAAPASGDFLVIASEYTASGRTSYTVTMDNTSTSLILGSDTASVAAIEVCGFSTLQFATTASTNFIIKMLGVLVVRQDSTFTCGSTDTPIPSTSTAIIEFTSGTSSRHGMYSTGTPAKYQVIGANVRGNGRAYLGAQANASATTLTVSDANDISGWKASDEIIISGTTSASGSGELRTLSVDASGTTLTLSSGLTFLHAQYWNTRGTKPTPILNITKNVTIKGVSSTVLHGAGFSTNSIVRDCLFWFTGPNVLGTQVYKSGEHTRCAYKVAQANVTGANTSFTNCVGYQSPIFVVSGGNPNLNTDSLTIQNVVFNGGGIGVGSFTFYLYGGQTIQNLHFINYASTTNFVFGGAHGATVSGIYSSNGASTLFFTSLNPWLGAPNGTSGQLLTCEISDIICSRQSVTGPQFQGNSGLVVKDFEFTECTSTGVAVRLDANPQICFSSGYIYGVNGGTSSANLIYSTTSNAYFKNTTFGYSTNSEINIGSGATYHAGNTGDTSRIICTDCTFNSTISATSTSTRAVFGASSGPESRVIFHNTALNGTASSGDVQMVQPFGYTRKDTAIYKTQSPSTRMVSTTNGGAANNQKYVSSDPIWVPIPAGKKAKISVFVRKSVVGDGAAWTGGQVELWQDINFSDTEGLVTAVKLSESTSAANGAWELISGTTSSAQTNSSAQPFRIRALGSNNGTVAGWVNYDNFIVEYI